MMQTVSTEAIVVGVGVAAAATYIFRDQIFPKFKSSSVPTIPTKGADGSENPRDFVAKMISGVSRLPGKKKYNLTGSCSLRVSLSEKASGNFLRFANRYW
jgi:hypothetical protein